MIRLKILEFYKLMKIDIGSGPISNFHIPAIKNNEFIIEAIGSRKIQLDTSFASQYQLSIVVEVGESFI